MQRSNLIGDRFLCVHFARRIGTIPGFQSASIGIPLSVDYIWSREDEFSISFRMFIQRTHWERDKFLIFCINILNDSVA